MKIQAKSDIDFTQVEDADTVWITQGNVYPVLGIDSEFYRIIDDQKEPILYRKENFDIVDSVIPDHWVKKEYPDGDYYIDPPEFSEPGFYEDYFDGRPQAVKIYERYLTLNGLKDYIKSSHDELPPV